MERLHLTPNPLETRGQWRFAEEEQGTSRRGRRISDSRLPPKRYSGNGEPPVVPRRATRLQPLSVKALALSLPEQQFQTITWREGTKEPLRGRFAALRGGAALALRKPWVAGLRHYASLSIAGYAFLMTE